jgi:hypothetical protein
MRDGRVFDGRVFDGFAATGAVGEATVRLFERDTALLRPRVRRVGVVSSLGVSFADESRFSANSLLRRLYA